MCLLWILLEIRNHWKFLWRLIFVMKSEISCFCGCYFLPKVRYHHRPNNCKERYWSVEESSNKWFCPNMKSNLNILEKVLNFSMCLLVCGERERERERERGNYGVEKLRNYTRGNENKDGRWGKNFWTKLLCKQVIPLQWYIMLVRREKISKPHSKGSVAMLELFKFIPNQMA